VKLLATVPLDTGIYTMRYTRDGSRVLAAGEDGRVRFISASDAKVVAEFTPVPLTPNLPQAATAQK